MTHSSEQPSFEQSIESLLQEVLEENPDLDQEYELLNTIDKRCNINAQIQADLLESIQPAIPLAEGLHELLLVRRQTDPNGTLDDVVMELEDKLKQEYPTLNPEEVIENQKLLQYFISLGSTIGSIASGINGIEGYTLSSIQLDILSASSLGYEDKEHLLTMLHDRLTGDGIDLGDATALQNALDEREDQIIRKETAIQFVFEAMDDFDHTIAPRFELNRGETLVENLRS